VVGEDVFIGPGTQLLNDRFPPRFEKHLWEPARIEHHAIIGGGVTILPGVTIGAYARIGGGAVVTKDVPAAQIWVGNPAHELVQK
jgi:acetyltransferase-like isoleucine patch superfamily enzyme